ncbi:nucleophosmin [Canna indica]|uniref:Nucleophosmin n=1 Tax=Canna indica TaxID=4628 RepID=A0AAQ3Q554_9LILI|nr:nucleophosmin [Canna indica]
MSEAMAALSRGLVVLSSVLVLLSLFPLSLSSPKKVSSAARREDIPYIKCQVCEKVAHQIYHQVSKKEAQISPKKVSEFEIIEIAENVCNLKKEEADWVLQIDIVEKGDTLQLVEQGIEGMCNSECKTIERACQEVVDYADTDIAEFVFKTRPTADLLVKFLCHDLSKACLAEPPPVPKDRTPGEPFVAKPSGEAEMGRMLRAMEGIPGAPSMKMYSREDVLKNNFGDEELDDDDDEDDEDNFPAKLGKTLKNKDSPKKDFKQSVLKGITETGKKMKTHFNKASQRIRKWWRGKKSASKSPKKGKSEL